MGVNIFIVKRLVMYEIPKPVPIIVPDSHTGTYILDKKVLNEVIHHNKTENIPAVVLSIAGAFRTGKSFLLNFIIKYLKRLTNSSDWLTENSSIMRKGFPWKHGAERVTTGILLWSEIFKIEVEDGNEIGIMLIDTQGSFDGSSSMKGCATIFALSTLVSSIQIYNVIQQLQEDNLQHLSLFTDYGKLVTSTTNSKPFNKLLLLVRDWSFAYDYSYGAVGGEELLKNKLSITANMHDDLKGVREHLRSCFDEISCFLMPHPGLQVSTNHSFEGSVEQMESEFVVQMKKLIPSIVDEKKLKVKKINGRVVTCSGICDYLERYIDIFNNNDDIPEPKSVLRATAEVNNLTVLKECNNYYIFCMEDICKIDKYVRKLDSKHNKIVEETLTKFDTIRKLGGETFALKYRDKLKLDMKKSFVNYKLLNENKKTMNKSHSPIAIVSFLIIMHISSKFFSYAYLEMFADLFGYLFLIGFFILFVWIFLKVKKLPTDQIDVYTECMYDYMIVMGNIVIKIILSQFIPNKNNKKT